MAGMAGGSILMLKYREISWRRALALVLSSGIASGYLTEVVVHGIGLKDGMIGAVGFAIGLTFILIFDALVNLLKFIAANPKMILGFLLAFLPSKKTIKTDEIENLDDDDPATEFDGKRDQSGEGQL